MYKADYSYILTYATNDGIVHKEIVDEDKRQLFMEDYRKYKELKYKWVFIERYFPQPTGQLKEFIDYARDVLGLHVSFRECKEGEKPDTLESIFGIEKDKIGNYYLTPPEKDTKLSIKDAITELACIKADIPIECYEMQEALTMGIVALGGQLDLKL